MSRARKTPALPPKPEPTERQLAAEQKIVDDWSPEGLGLRGLES